MLPMTLQFLIAMIAAAINDRLQRKLDYVEEERRVLQEQLDALTGGKKVSFTADQRRRLAAAGKAFTPDERRKCCHLVKPATILAWFRQIAARKYDSSEAGRGRPPKPRDVRKLVIKLATENPGLGVHQAQGCLAHGAGGRDLSHDGGEHLGGGRPGASAGAREEAHVETVHEGAVGFALRL